MPLFYCLRRGLDAGVSEVFTDERSQRYGEQFGQVLAEASDQLKDKGQKRNRLYQIARQAEASRFNARLERGNPTVSGRTPGATGQRPIANRRAKRLAQSFGLSPQDEVSLREGKRRCEMRLARLTPFQETEPWMN